MSREYSTIEDLKGRIDNEITDVTKCYILIKYALNTADENILYKEEFKKRYNNLYITVHEINDSEIDNADLYRKILGIDNYEEGMKFLDNKTLEYVEKDEDTDMDYDIKASMSSVKFDFYKNNTNEFGNNTRFHIETDGNSPINPVAKSEEEKRCIFDTLTNFYKNILLEESNIKVLKKNM